MVSWRSGYPRRTTCWGCYTVPSYSTGYNCVGDNLHRMRIFNQPNCLSCNLEEIMKCTNGIVEYHCMETLRRGYTGEIETFEAMPSIRYVFYVHLCLLTSFLYWLAIRNKKILTMWWTLSACRIFTSEKMDHKTLLHVTLQTINVVYFYY